MKASEMTNEQLAKDLDGYATETDAKGWPTYSATLREAAARLRTLTLLSKAHQRLANDSVDYEANILNKLKVVEDALVKLQDRLVSSVHDGTIDPYAALKIVENSLAAIRE